MVDPQHPAGSNGDLRLANQGSLPGALVAGSAALATPEGSGASPLAGQAGAAADVPQDEEREVDWGGTKRKMKLSELSKLAYETTEARELKQLADRQLREVAGLKGIAETLRKATPERRELIRRVIQDDQFVPAPQPRGKAKAPDDLLDEGTDGDPGISPQFASRLDKMEAVLGNMLDVMQGQVNERREVDLSSQIENAMRQFPVFEAAPTLAKQARGHILATIAKDEGQNLLGLVTDYARQSQSIVDELAGRSSAPMARGIPDLRPGTQKARSAKDLLDGTVDRDVSMRLGLRR